MRLATDGWKLLEMGISGWVYIISKFFSQITKLFYALPSKKQMEITKFGSPLPIDIKSAVNQINTKQ